MATSIVRMLFCFVLFIVLNACATVKPWERGTLASREMSIVPNPTLQSFREQVYKSREAAQGGSKHSVGGCGCN